MGSVSHVHPRCKGFVEVDLFLVPYYDLSNINNGATRLCHVQHWPTTQVRVVEKIYNLVLSIERAPVENAKIYMVQIVTLIQYSPFSPL